MFNLIITKEIHDKIGRFIDSYLNSFLHLFQDSWIDNIDIIEEHYIKLAKDLERTIYFSLKKRMSDEVVLWKKIDNDKSLSIIILSWNWKLSVSYTESLENKIRIIRDIKFCKK